MIKWLNKKIRISFLSLLVNILPQLIFPILSYLTVQKGSLEIWGEFAISLITIQLMSQLLSFGHREFLFRKFIKEPNKMIVHWQENFKARSTILLPILLVFYFIFPDNWIYLTLWLLSNHLTITFQSIVNYNRDYKKTFVFEFTALILTVLFTVYRPVVNSNLLIIVFTFYNLARATLYCLAYRLYLKNIPITVNLSLLKEMFPFLLPIIIGLLQKRMELHLSINYLEDSELGTYQILMTFLSYHMTIVAYIILPFTKTLFKMGDSTFGKFRTKANLLSVPFSIIVGFIIWLILGIYYKIEMGWEVLLLICVYLFPYLSYSVDMYFLIKHDRMLILAKCFALAMIPNLILALYLLPNWGWIGGLISATISQMILWRLIRYETNKVQNKLLNI